MSYGLPRDLRVQEEQNVLIFAAFIAGQTDRDVWRCPQSRIVTRWRGSRSKLLVPSAARAFTLRLRFYLVVKPRMACLRGSADP